MDKSIYICRMATVHRVVQQQVHDKIVSENKDKWAEWQRKLDEKEQEENAQGHYNYGADFLEDVKDDESHQRAVNFLPYHNKS